MDLYAQVATDTQRELVGRLDRWNSTPVFCSDANPLNLRASALRKKQYFGLVGSHVRTRR